MAAASAAAAARGAAQASGATPPAKGKKKRKGSKVRRLYDIANVLRSLRLIQKVTLSEPNKPKKTAFMWLGADVFPLKSTLDPSQYEVSGTNAPVAFRPTVQAAVAAAAPPSRPGSKRMVEATPVWSPTKKQRTSAAFPTGMVRGVPVAAASGAYHIPIPPVISPAPLVAGDFTPAPQSVIRPRQNMGLVAAAAVPSTSVDSNGMPAFPVAARPPRGTSSTGT